MKPAGAFGDPCHRLCIRACYSETIGLWDWGKLTKDWSLTPKSLLPPAFPVDPGSKSFKNWFKVEEVFKK